MFKKIMASILIVFILFSFIFVPLFMVNGTTSGDFSIYSSDSVSLGLSKLRISIDEYKSQDQKSSYQIGTIMSNLLIMNTVGDSENTVFMKIGFSRNLTDRETSAIINFVNAGGKAVIADDTGYANSLSERYGVRYYGSILWDEGNLDPLYKDISFPIAHVRDPDISPTKDYQVVMNKPTGIAVDTNKNNIFVASVTSNDTFIDFNNNHRVDTKGDKAMSTPTIVRVNANSGGILYFISDPGMFTNAVYDTHDNTNFVLDMLHSLLPSGGRVIFDESGTSGDRFIYPVAKSIGIVGGIASMDMKKTESYSLIIFFIALVVAVAYLVSEKEIWIHKFNLHTFRGVKKIPSKEYVKRLYSATKMKIGLKAMLSIEEVNELPAEKLVSYVDDEDLKAFLTSPDATLKKNDIINILEKIKAMKK